MKKSFISIVIIFTIFGHTVLFAQDTSNKVNMLEIVISNLVSRVEALEKRVNALEKNLTPGVSKTPKSAPANKELLKPPLKDGFEDIGSGFFVRNVRFDQFGSNVLFTGEIANRSEKNYRFAKFTLEIYDERDLLVKKEEFTIPDIPKDSTKPFEAMLIGIETGLINKYVIKTTE
ncbi:MAG: hypothetical protein DWB56_04760 [Candidatus Jettenia sp.]|uniref:Uncharacterized protein n=1 Tax=Candidatus Jettenia caeni TaxID=247490 RepID=I3IIF2_9BACT|nr:hypothetical protein [Candidatus Jettenia sp. AMX1]MBC6928266.1 hypothetical protein [Candidatus Jettenia sp.]WKZ16817.1 MAG: hypothetical protein QY317_05775 [Candidatus Jettenia caeni]KAA0249971.1 MAG: hypothetical protein EDM77_06820 [Candidatus Jettenia sp. AMX1]MCE7880452.1 hypothetical protein [Candidatus Jettenia sp. AMX1]MCQ3926260.1 hypothetical protein [Candidatus Jettenia sp.]